MNRFFLQACGVFAACFFLPATLLAHESIAAQYVVPHEEFVWQVYQPDMADQFDEADIVYKPGWYVGLGTGLSEVSPEGSDGGFYVEDDRDWGYKIFAGYRFLPHWSAEASYVYTGQAGLGNVNPAIEAEISDATISYHIPTIAANYHVFGPKRDLDLFARVGISSIINRVSDDRIPYDKQTPLQLNFGAGVQWRFAPKWFARVEYDGYDNDASLFAVSIGRYFAKHDEHREIAPVVVEPAIEEPAEEPVVPEIVCEQFNNTIDAIQFEVDSDTLTPESETLLIETARLLMEYSDIVLEVQAHTDSTASDEYNLDLSNRRAQTIKRFLVQQGIPEDQLFAVGFGESQPRASNETEAGRAQNRRVEFKVLEGVACKPQGTEATGE